MNKDELNSYRREYNKSTYKTVKVYIPVDEYDGIINHMKQSGYDKLSGYIKSLIDADMNK